MKKYNYGIFTASIEIRTRHPEAYKISNPEGLWDVVDRDENIGDPLEVFGTKEEALEALKKYTSEEDVHHYDNFYYLKYTVYFVAELDLLDDEREGELDAYVNSDGVEIAPRNRRV